MAVTTTQAGIAAFTLMVIVPVIVAMLELRARSKENKWDRK